MKLEKMVPTFQKIHYMDGKDLLGWGHPQNKGPQNEVLAAEAPNFGNHSLPPLGFTYSKE